MMNAGSFAPALVLNADFRPLNYFPLSLWSWQDAVKAVCLDRVTIVSEYEDSISSPSFEMKLPSVIALKEYVPQVRNPAFTRFNVFLRDKFSCQYCGTPHAAADLRFDAHGSSTLQITWEGRRLNSPSPASSPTSCVNAFREFIFQYFCY